MVVNFTRVGEAIADHDGIKRALAMYRGYGPKDKVNTSSIVLLRAFQLLIAQGKVDPTKVEFMYEGQKIEHDRLGRFIKYPIEFTSAVDVLTQQFERAIKDKVHHELTEEQTKAIQEHFRSWFKVNIEDVFKEGFEFYYANELSGRERMTVLDGRPTFIVEGWGSAPDGTPLCALKVKEDPKAQVILSAYQISMASFDKEGFRLVPEPFDIKQVYQKIGLDPTLVEPSFDLPRPDEAGNQPAGGV